MSDRPSQYRDHLLLDTNGRTDLTDEALRRATRRLTSDRKPSTAASTGSWVDWAATADYLGQPFDATRIPFSKLEQMRRDPMLAFGMAFIKMPLIRAPWYIKCSDPRIASAVQNALQRIYGRFILAYTNSFDYGFSPMVKRFVEDKPDWTYIDESGDEKKVWGDKAINMIVWKPFTALDPKNAQPHWTSRGEFNGIDFRNGSSLGVSPFFNGPASIQGFNVGGNRIADIPLDWALWATNEKDSVFGSYWGYPRIGYAYRYWWAYWYRFALADRAFEKWADPPLMSFFPDEIDAVDGDGNSLNLSDEALALAEKLRSGANVAMPSQVVTGMDERPTNIRSWWVEQMESKADFEALNKAFEYLDVQKLRAVMVPEQALIEGKGGSSSRNVAAEFGDVFQAQQAVVKQEIDDHLNRYVIPQFVEVNFGEKSPRAEIVTTGFDPQDIDTARALVQAFSNKEGKGDLPVDTRTLLERLGIPLMSPRDWEEKLREEAEKAAEMTPPAVKPIPNEQAGFDQETGNYFPARERIIVLQGPNGESREVDLDEAKIGDLVSKPLAEAIERLNAATEATMDLAQKEISLNVNIPETQPRRAPTKVEYNEDGLVSRFIPEDTEEVSDDGEA